MNWINALRHQPQSASPDDQEIPNRPPDQAAEPNPDDLSAATVFHLRPPPPSHPEVVAATELWAAWDTNAVAAEDRWGGRDLVVVGRVERVVRRSADTLALHLENDRRLTPVVCLFPEASRDALAQLARGERVEVRGRVRALASYELLVDCVEML